MKTKLITILLLVLLIALYGYSGEDVVGVEEPEPEEGCKHLEGTCEYHSCMSKEAFLWNEANLEETRYTNCLLKLMISK